MPFRSQAQWKWAFATNQDFARRWAKEMPGGKRRFTRLSKRLGMKAAIDEYMTSYKEREYVRDASGQFAEKPGGGLDKAAAAQRKVEQFAKPAKGGGNKAPKKPSKTPAQRAAERATERRDSAMETLDKVGFDASDYELLNTSAAQDAGDPSVQRLLDKGLMERVGDKIYVSPLGKQVTSAAESGDADKAQQTIDRAGAKRAEREARQQAQDERRAEAEAKREAKRQEAEEKKKRGGGGGGKGGAKKPDATAKREAAKKKRQAVARTKRIARLEQQLERETDGKKAQALRDAIDKLRSTKAFKADGHTPPDGVRQAAKRGLELRRKFGRGGTAVGVARARDLSNGKRISSDTIKRMVSFFARHAVDKRPDWADPSRPTNGYIAHMLWGGDDGKTWANSIMRQLTQTIKSASAPAQVTVYKSKDGYRWVAISSTAYRDRDKEIVSTKALKGALEKAQASGDYGPLRFWHVPGLDIGTTDYQALSDDGKYLIESGIVASDEIAEALMQKGKGWQVSIGFEHPKTEPDTDGVFENIRIFERSITPPGRAANPMTGFDMVDRSESVESLNRLKRAVKELRYKHGKHDQKSHGRKTARRAAYQAAYSAAKAEGKTIAEARDAAKSASRVELEKRIAERRAEVAQRAQERASKRAQDKANAQNPAYSSADDVAGARATIVNPRNGNTELDNGNLFVADSRNAIPFLDSDKYISSERVEYTTAPESKRMIARITRDALESNPTRDVMGGVHDTPRILVPNQIGVSADGRAFLMSEGTLIPITDRPASNGQGKPISLSSSQADAIISAYNAQTGLRLRRGTPEIKQSSIANPIAQNVMRNGGNYWSRGVGERIYVNDARIPSGGKLYYDVSGKKWSADGVPDDVASTLIAQYSQ